MLRKLAVVVIAVALFVGTGSALAAQGPSPKKPPVVGGAPGPQMNSCGWTNIKFAEFLAENYGITIPKGQTPMSEADRYTALANALSQKGINYFSGANPGNKVSCCETADTLYKVVGAPGNAGGCDVKINYLIQNGFLKAGSNPCDELCDIPTSFGGPVVEKFRPPRFPRPPTGPPGKLNEIPASTTE